MGLALCCVSLGWYREDEETRLQCTCTR